jgi:signal transduction histidine kinase
MPKDDKAPKHLTILIIVFPLIVLLVYGILSYTFFLYSQKKDSIARLNIYEQNFMNLEKERLKEKINSMVDFINYYDNQSSVKIKQDVKHIVSVAVDMANNLYKKYKGVKSDQEIKEMIISALDGMKFEGNMGYLFILDLKGNVILHIDKKMQGTNILNIQDIYGKYIIKEFNKVLKSSGEGFVDYYWYIANEDKKRMHYKISFVKMLDCYEWYIGAGEYLKYMKKFVQKEILEYISSNSKFYNGYFFIFDKEGRFILHPDNNRSVDMEVYKNEGFKKSDNEISYSRYIDEYGWYVVAVRSLKDIRATIMERSKQIEAKQRSDTKTNLYLLAVSWVISLLLSLYLSYIINRLLQNYKSKLDESNEQLIFQSRQALIGELFSMIAHQWRQPINKIASILALLRFDLSSKKPSYQEIDGRCEDIEDHIEFMSETIDDFRTFYRPKEHTEVVYLNEVIDRSIIFMESILNKKSIKIVKELESVRYRLYANEFLQVMLNLIKNAIDAIDKEGEIKITLKRNSDKKVMISVEDNGKGIDKSDISKLFDPYFTTKKESMGLGLYMTKMIIEKHMGGTIKVERLKKGTRFTITL